MGQSGGNEAASLFPALGIASDPEPATRFSAAENAAVRILAAAALTGALLPNYPRGKVRSQPFYSPLESSL